MAKIGVLNASFFDDARRAKFLVALQQRVDQNQVGQFRQDEKPRAEGVGRIVVDRAERVRAIRGAEGFAPVGLRRSTAGSVALQQIPW